MGGGGKMSTSGSVSVAASQTPLNVYPELVQIEAEYDINFDGKPVYAGLFDDFLINEAIYHE